MKFNLTVLSTVLAFAGVPAYASENPDALFELFQGLAGKWECDGAFANGKALSADINMSVTNNGRALTYSHIDKAPNNYVVSGHWSYFKKLNEMVVTLHSADDVLTTYKSKEWSKNSVTFEAVEYFAPPLWRQNRFTYLLKDNGTLFFEWQVMSEQGWKMGDYLNCVAASIC